jgi:quercetin dioxygenase-like cupin family protein
MSSAVEPRRQPLSREESIRSGSSAGVRIEPGVTIREFVSKQCGASGFSTGVAILEPGAVLPYHLHRFSEAITVLRGEATVAAAGRTYRLERHDSVHMPSGLPHRVSNESSHRDVVAHWTFASDAPSREFVETMFPVQDRGLEAAAGGDPEYVARFAGVEPYEPAAGTSFRDLFAARFGTVGICGGYARFEPGASLPCHIHNYDESTTIIEGEAVCQVQGRSHRLSGYDTAFVPAGYPHRFLNESGAPMAMIWVCAAGETAPVIVENGFCSDNGRATHEKA